jgi:hypothetical protein
MLIQCKIFTVGYAHGRLAVATQGQILDSKEFYAPIITPFEAQMAFLGTDWNGSEYSLDFGPLPAPEASSGERA